MAAYRVERGRAMSEADSGLKGKNFEPCGPCGGETGKQCETCGGVGVVKKVLAEQLFDQDAIAVDAMWAFVEKHGLGVWIRLYGEPTDDALELIGWLGAEIERIGIETAPKGK